MTYYVLLLDQLSAILGGIDMRSPFLGILLGLDLKFVGNSFAL
jgi:hypothetical protein